MHAHCVHVKLHCCALAIHLLAAWVVVHCVNAWMGTHLHKKIFPNLTSKNAMPRGYFKDTLFYKCE